MYPLYYKGLRLSVTFQVKHLCVGDFASFAKIFAGFYFGKGIGDDNTKDKNISTTKIIRDRFIENSSLLRKSVCLEINELWEIGDRSTFIQKAGLLHHKERLDLSQTTAVGRLLGVSQKVGGNLSHTGFRRHTSRRK